MKRTIAAAVAIAGLAAALLGLRHAAARASAIATTYRDHMEMTLLGAQRPGDRARADAIVAAARRVMAEYPTVDAAQAAGYAKFLPGVSLPIEHYTNRRYAFEAWLGRFDPMHPTSLIFRRDGDALHVVGVMYTAANSDDREQLDAMVPLSFGTWHRHVDFCKAPPGTPLAQRIGPEARFGFEGSLHAKDACEAAGGTFIPRVFGWMVHVWPLETSDAKIWAVDAHAGSMVR